MKTRRDINASIDAARQVLADQLKDLERQEKLIAAHKEAGDDVTDLEEMVTLQKRMHALASRRLESSAGKADGQ